MCLLPFPSTPMMSGPLYGQIQNMCADIVIFNPLKTEDQAAYKNPHGYPKGIPYVIVNGELVVENGEHTGALPGKVIRGPRYSK